jgi:hypothetical protein
MMTSLLSIWVAMIRAYRSSHMPDSRVVRTFWVFCYGSCPMGHVFAKHVFWVYNFSNMFYKL